LVLGFGSETICPSREIGEAIPVFSFAGIGIEISRRFIGGDFHFQIWEERTFFFGTCEELGVSLELGASSTILLRVGY
jgi:hypothetical protein